MRKNHLNLLFWTIAVTAISIVFSSCNNNDDEGSKLQVYWQLYLNPQFQVPAVSGNETGVVAMQLFSDNSLDYYIKVNNLTAGDQLTMAHFHAGAAGTNGDILVTLCATAADFGMNKTITLTSEQISTIRTASTYVNVHSTNHTTGVVRGQLVNGIANPPTNPSPY